MEKSLINQWAEEYAREQLGLKPGQSVHTEQLSYYKMHKSNAEFLIHKTLSYVMERVFEESEVATFPPDNGKIREDCCAGIKCRTLKSIIEGVG